MIIILNLIFLSMLLPSLCKAGVADLSLELDFDTQDGIVIERQGEFVARITNNGPDIAAATSTLQHPISFSSGIIRVEQSLGLPLVFAPSVNNNNNICFFTTVIGEPPPGGTLSYVFIFNVPSMAVNETIECLGVYATYFQSGIREVNWQIRNSFDHDPNTDNNSQIVTFGIPPKAVPVNNVFVLVLLLLLVFYFGYQSKSNDDIKNTS